MVRILQMFKSTPGHLRMPSVEIWAAQGWAEHHVAELGTRLGPDSHMGKPETAVIISTCHGPDTALKHFTWTNQLSEDGTLISLIYKLVKKGTEKLSGLTSITQVLKSRAWSWTGSEAPVLEALPHADCGNPGNHGRGRKKNDRTGEPGDKRKGPRRGLPWGGRLRFHTSITGIMGSIPGRGTKILHMLSQPINQ